MPLRTALCYYHKAALWSVLISMATVMESYDMQLISSLYAFPQFKKKYGNLMPNGLYELDPQWQIGLSMASLIGLIFGVFASGYLGDRFGPRYVMITAHTILIAFISIVFTANSVEVLFVGELLCALTWGLFAAATPTYAAEIVPMALRGYLTTYVNLCWVIGRLLATGVLRGMLPVQSEWSFRIPFALQWMWPPFLIIATWFAPESPWWLVCKGRIEEARKTLNRVITAPKGAVNNDHRLAMMQHTIELEQKLKVGGSFMDCFKGTNLRRTEIAMISWGGQILPGFIIQGYTTYFFTLAGLPTKDSFNMTLGTFSMAFVGTCGSWLLQGRMGRRTIYISGLAIMMPIMWTVAFLEFVPNAGTNSSIKWAQSSILMVWFFTYGITIGPIPYAIAAEVGAVKLRYKTIALGRNTYYFLSIINHVIAPYMLNPKKWDLKGKAAFPAAILNVLLLLWAYFRLPETKGMTPETLDHLFHEKVSARKFKQDAERFQ
ncbi:general substrate transporter [Paraphoma chrysanthemicola]|uniref:General substrate transporter n=1 Tax=Paraphoma chrysanthemicola TaxID=798071 RepID=A0A8K0VWK7_9PLEO|nr:general substrate transporter [Paraphoma chrysanthemicola]